MALRIWLPLNGSLENKGISDITVTNNGATVDNNGKIGKCYSFNGNYIKTDYSNYPNIFSGDFSICFWVYSTTNKARDIYFANYGLSGSGNWFNLERDANNYLRFWWANGSPDYHNNNFVINQNEWTHIVITRSGNTLTAYKNGNFINTYSTTLNNAIPSTATTFYLGADYRTGQSIDLYGKINDFRLYDHCLSPLEVKEISQGLILHYKLDGFSGGAGENLAIGTNTANISTNVFNQSNQTGGISKEIVYDNGIPCVKITRNDTAQSGWKFFSYNNFLRNNIKTSTQYTVSFDIKASVNGTIGFTGLVQGNATNYMTKSTSVEQGTVTQNIWSHIILHCITKDSFSDITISSQVIYMSPSASLVDIGVSYLLKNMKLEEGKNATSWTPATSEMGIDTTKIIDSSGYEYNLNIVGNPSTSTDTERYSQSMYVSNGTYFINPVSCKEYMPTDSLTVNIWIKPITWNNPISCTQGGGWNFESSPIRFPVYVSGIGYKTATSTTTGASLVGDWHMLTGTFDKENVKIYIDGELQATTATGSTNGISYANNGLVIGGEASSSTTAADSSAYTGNISDVRIYATALSAEDILDLYHTPVNIDNLQNIHSFEFQENGIKTSIYQNGIMSTIDEIHESNAELLNNFTSGTFTPLKNRSDSINFGIIDFSNYTDLNQDLKIHIELDAEWTAFTPDTGGTFWGIWFSGANYKIGATSATWADINYLTSSLNSAHPLWTATAIASAGKYHFDTIATIPASWFATYDRSNFGMRCDYSDGTGVFKISNVKIIPLQYYNAKIGEDFISANNFIEK